MKVFSLSSHFHPNSRRARCMLVLATALSVFAAFPQIASSQTLMPIPAHSAAYTGYCRGYWFQAPCDFNIRGVRVPTEASTDSSCIEIQVNLAAANILSKHPYQSRILDKHCWIGSHSMQYPHPYGRLHRRTGFPLHHARELYVHQFVFSLG